MGPMSRFEADFADRPIPPFCPSALAPLPRKYVSRFDFARDSWRYV